VGYLFFFIGSIGKVATRFTVYEFVKANLPKLDDKVTFSRYIVTAMLGGGIGGACEAVVAVTPMETIKTKLIHDSHAPIEQRKYKGVIHGVTTIVRAEGWHGIYKAPLATVIKQSTNQMARFGVYDSIKYYITGSPTGHLNFFQNLMAGATAGAVSVILNNPFDVVKSQMQGLESSKYTGIIDCFKKILNQQGPGYFYRGVTPRMIRVCGDAAISFTAYNELVELINNFTKR